MNRSIVLYVLINTLLTISCGAPTVHTVFTTECGAYFTWQSMGMIFSHRKSGQPGPLTRIMNCTPKEWESLSEEQKTVVATHVAPSYTHHPRTGDHYSAYNKPVAVIDWLARNDVKEDYVLIIDADMIMMAPFVPDKAGAKPGQAVSAFFGYMKGVNNRLALKHVPEVDPRNDTLAGPVGRRGDQVGGFTLMNTDDLRRVAPLWLKYTEDVRADPDAWELTGDAYSKNPGDKPWISEMYGYSYACSKSNVWHIVNHGAMLYPGYNALQVPHVLHYGLYWKVEGTEYEFDKHWHYDFDPFKCPPWDLSPKASKSTKGGLFAHPPRASSFKTEGFELLRDLLAIEVVVTLNQAFCERHRMKCLPTEELTRECSYVDEYAAELVEKLEEIAASLPDPCQDLDARCSKWAKNGECEKNSGYMTNTCAKSCKKCKPRKGNQKSLPGSKTVMKGRGKGTKKPKTNPPPPSPTNSDYDANSDYVQRDEDTFEDESYDDPAVANDSGLGGSSLDSQQENGAENVKFETITTGVRDSVGGAGTGSLQNRNHGAQEQGANIAGDNQNGIQVKSEEKNRMAETAAQNAAQNANLRANNQDVKDDAYKVENVLGIRGTYVQDQNDGKMEDAASAKVKPLKLDAVNGKTDLDKKPAWKFQNRSVETDNRDVKVVVVNELKLRCTRFLSWKVDRIKRCLLMAEKGVTYDPDAYDPISSVDFHSEAHRLVGHTHDVGRILGQGLSGVHLRENAGRAQEAARSISLRGWVVWGAVICAVVVLILHLKKSQRRRNGGPILKYQYGRHMFKYNRTSARED